MRLRVFLAGATGVIGIRLLPLLLAEGHVVVAMTRTVAKVEDLYRAGVTAVACDVFDAEALTRAVVAARPDLVMHQVTDLPDDVDRLPEFLAGNARVRGEGTRNLIAAAQAAKATGFVAQSIAWGGGPVIDGHEQSVLAIGGCVLRYGRFYGPGTYYEQEPPPSPRIRVDDAAQRTMAFLAGPRGVVTIADDEPGAAQ